MKPTPAVEKFLTRSKGNIGARIVLLDPVTHLPTDDWLHIHSVDSDVFKLAEVRAMRESARLQDLPAGDHKDKALIDNRLELVASLVQDWSFNQNDEFPATYENVLSVLREAPQICEYINRQAADRSLFTGSSSNSCGITLLPHLNSTDAQVAQESPTETT